MRPSVATVSLLDAGRVQVVLEFNAEAWLAEIPPSVSDTNDALNAAQYDAYRAESDDTLESRIREAQSALMATIGLLSDETLVPLALQAIRVIPETSSELPRLTELVLVGGLTPGVETLSYRVDPSHVATAVRFVLLADTPPEVDYVMTGEQSRAINLDAPVERALSALIASYVALGFVHILPKGLDHIVFILGLVLLSHRMMDLVWQVTAFTVAHSVTLALGLYGVVTLSPSIVEPLIAASIAYVAIENVFRSTLVRSRTVIVFLFGLLHGLGFAGVLTELGLPPRDFVVGLLAFNVGVELGQFAVIAGAYLSLGYWVLNAPWYRSRIAIPASLMIGALGTFWCIERLGWLG